MSFFDPNIQDKLRDLESPLNQRVSFEEVMNRREKKKRRGIFFYMPRIVVVAGLFFAAGLGYYSWNTYQSKSGKESLVINQLSVRKSAKKNHQKVAHHESNHSVVAEKDSRNSQYAPTSNEVKQVGIVLRKHDLANAGLTSHRNVDLNASMKQSKRKVLRAGVDQRGLEYFNQNLNQTSLERLEVNSIQSNAGIQLQIVESKIASNPIAQPVVGQTHIDVPNAIELDQTQTKFQENIAQESEFLIWSRGLEVIPMEPQYAIPEYVERKGEDLFAHAPKNPPQSPYFLEFGAATGSRVLLNFDPTLPLSILGSQYNAQYQLAGLKDIGGDLMVGIGATYGEWIGNGEWQKHDWKTYEVHDSVVLIDYPNQGNRQVIHVDSTITELQTTIGQISYRINKLSVPLILRKHAMIGKIPVRLGMQIAPGRTLKTSGYYFSDFEYHTIDKAKLTTMDLKLAVGPSFAISKNYTIVIEPNVNLQAFYDNRSSKLYSKSFYGFGFSLLRRF